MFDRFQKPVVYIPGDNEWTDCHRLNNGGYDNLERLVHVRQAHVHQRHLRLRDPAGRAPGTPGVKYVETARFLHQGIMFVGVNVPGSNNNRVLDAKDCSNKSARTAAQLARQTTRSTPSATPPTSRGCTRRSAKATIEKVAGVMIVFQGDPGFDIPETEDQDESRTPDHSGYFVFLVAIIRETEAFSGQVLGRGARRHALLQDR